LFPAELVHRTIRKVAASIISVSFCTLTTLSNLICGESIKVFFWCIAPIFLLPILLKPHISLGNVYAPILLSGYKTVRNVTRCSATIQPPCSCVYAVKATLVLCKREYPSYVHFRVRLPFRCLDAAVGATQEKGRALRMQDAAFMLIQTNREGWPPRFDHSAP